MTQRLLSVVPARFQALLSATGAGTRLAPNMRSVNIPGRTVWILTALYSLSIAVYLVIILFFMLIVLCGNIWPYLTRANLRMIDLSAHVRRSCHQAATYNHPHQ